MGTLHNIQKNIKKVVKKFGSVKNITYLCTLN